MKLASSSLVVLALLAGCSKQSDFTPRVASALPDSQVNADATRWVLADPANRVFYTVADTHSMEPFFTSKSIPLCIKYSGQELSVGNVVDYFHDEHLPNVLHTVVAVSGDQVMLSGYNNHSSDGWFAKSRVKAIVVGQLYRP